VHSPNPPCAAPTSLSTIPAKPPSNPSNPDARANLPSRRLHQLRRQRTRRKRSPALPAGGTAPAGRAENVRDAGAGVGELAAGVYRAGDVFDPMVF